MRPTVPSTTTMWAAEGSKTGNLQSQSPLWATPQASGVYTCKQRVPLSPTPGQNGGAAPYALHAMINICQHCSFSENGNLVK